MKIKKAQTNLDLESYADAAARNSLGIEGITFSDQVLSTPQKRADYQKKLEALKEAGELENGSASLH